MKYRCGLFDLDGVIVDTAKYHFLAWKVLADRLGFEFTEIQNEKLKGVSRMRSLEILLSQGGVENRFTESEKQEMAEEKNRLYTSYIMKLEKAELLGGVISLFEEMKSKNIRIGLGSASKNAGLILDRLEIRDYFDVIVDGNSVIRAKPDPEVFALGARELGIPYEQCVVFEDSLAGIQAAKALGMYAVGIGERENLPLADCIVTGVGEFRGF